MAEVLVVGGGIVGLAIAVELKLRGANVTVLSRDFAQAATHAAAGMLAPEAEHLTSPAMRSLCLRSRNLYPDWIRKLESISGQNAGYWPCGILAPVFQEPDRSIAAQWLDATAIHYAQPGLSPAVIGGWWFPEDAQVDNRRLAQTLQSVAESIGVDLQEGVEVEAVRYASLKSEQRQNQVTAIKTANADWQAEHYILATGAWSAALLPIPTQPRKGQMLSVRVPIAAGLPLQRVLYGESAYIVPRRDGRIVIGATSEAAGFMPGNTVAGIHSLLHEAVRLYPALKEFAIEEQWWGFRPETPDEMPILGQTHCQNLTVATGHYRNGILLAPITAQLIADAVWDQRIDPLLPEFSWQRFQQPRTFATISSPTPAEAPVQTLDVVQTAPQIDDRPLTIAGRTFRSRLMTGTGKYRNFAEMQQAIESSGCEIITVAVRRVQTNAPGHQGLAEAIDWQKLWMLPNTAGCQTAEDAIRVARLGREMAKLLGQEDNNFVKLEVIPDAKYLLPDPIGTLQAAEQLVKEGFAVLPYINADPLLAKRLEEAGCATVMPLGSPIGSGQGIRNQANIEIIIENANIPVVVDAGIGTPSEAAQAMEMGADALLINTAIAQAQNPALMGQAMGMAAIAGRMAYLAGRIPVKSIAAPSSPMTGTIG
ncbi:MAG: glycine oxidase ThiO [Leptolyngbyaceae cyanobacterium SM1_3_5]|nr:glycine oxidase ThiO [Leptolyngbyaceae cyanobacterium SM1_3_5]